MRKLASIQTITNIHPIANADAIEVADILGWHVVIKKDDHFKIGDKVVYVEIDSLMPEDKPAFDFLKKENGKMSRIKTISLRGQTSQGIAFPMSILPEGNYEVGQDVTDIIGVVKYEPPIPACLEGKIKGAFPAYVPKSDETRVQVLQEVLDRYKGTPMYHSEKIDGTSVTYAYKDNEFDVCSRNNNWLESESNSMWKIARVQKLEEKLKSLNLDIALQGELHGEGIQGNKYKMHGQDVRYFNAFDIKTHTYFNFEDFLRLMKELNLLTVPILATNVPLINDIDALVEQSRGMSVLNANTHREGIVIRPMVELKDYTMGRVSFKAINPKFLLKYEDS